MGVISALNRNKLPDRITMIISTIGVVVPSFVMATFLLYFFSVKFAVLPTFGVETWQGYILPAVCLAVGPICGIARLSRSSMLDTLNQDYMRTAESKGLSRSRIIICSWVTQLTHPSHHFAGHDFCRPAHGYLRD